MQKRQTIVRLNWFSSILRWTLGCLFAFVGFKYLHQGGWPAIAFGGVIFVTGFFSPRRCVNDTCTR